MTPEERSAAKCFVVMRGENAAAACVIDGSSPELLRKFLNECAGEDIRTVTVAEARILLSNAKGRVIAMPTSKQSRG